MGRFRAFAAVVLTAVLVAGGLGLLGVRSSTASAQGGGHDLEVTYPRVACSGLDVPWSVKLRREGGFDGEIVLAVDTSYIEILEMRGRLPEPASETAGGGSVYLTSRRRVHVLAGRTDPCRQAVGRIRIRLGDGRRNTCSDSFLRDLVGALMEIVVRAVVLFLFLFLWGITRLVGRSSVGELSTFQLVLFVAMGDLVQQGITQDDVSMTSAVLTIGVFAVPTLVLATINARYPRLRGITHGVPVVIVKDGEPDMQNLKRERLSLDDLLAAARQEGIRRFSDIELAVLETNGRVSFFTRTRARDGAPEEPDPV